MTLAVTLAQPLSKTLPATLAARFDPDIAVGLAMDLAVGLAVDILLGACPWHSTASVTAISARRIVALTATSPTWTRFRGITLKRFHLKNKKRKFAHTQHVVVAVVPLFGGQT